MKKAMIVLLVLLSGAVYSDIKTDPDRPVSDAKAKIIENLKQIENTYFKYLNFEERRAALRLLDETMVLVKKENFENYDNYHRKERDAMGNEAFQILLKQVQDANIDESKSQIIKTACVNAKISTGQLKTLLKGFRFEDNTEDCIESVYSSIYDKGNVTILLELFNPHSFIRDKFQNFIQSQAGKEK